MLPCYKWWARVPHFTRGSLVPPKFIGAPEMILHAPAIIAAPLATPEQSSSACRHWSRTRFSPKWTGSNASFKHVIWANGRLSRQTRGSFLSAVELSWVDTWAPLPGQRRKESGVQTVKHVNFKLHVLPKSQPRYKIAIVEHFESHTFFFLWVCIGSKQLVSIA